MIQKPYYADHQILTGQYTSGNEYHDIHGNDYIGGYHVLPNGQIFTEFRNTDNSIELFKKLFNITDSVKRYNQINAISSLKYVFPISKLIKPNLDDYTAGFYYRYFVQKRNNPLITIMEIDFDQFSSINTRNQIGINGLIWNSVSVNWKISGANIDYFNKKEVARAQMDAKFINLDLFIKDFKEYSK